MLERLNYGSLTLTEGEREELIKILIAFEEVTDVMGDYNIHDAEGLKEYLDNNETLIEELKKDLVERDETIVDLCAKIETQTEELERADDLIMELRQTIKKQKEAA